MGKPAKGAVNISDDEIRASLEHRGQLNDPFRNRRSFDDNRRLLDAITWLTEQDRKKIFEQNARKAYPRLDAPAGKL